MIRSEADTVRFLISSGADGIRIKDNDGRSAYNLACLRAHNLEKIAPLVDPSKKEVRQNFARKIHNFLRKQSEITYLFMKFHIDF